MIVMLEIPLDRTIILSPLQLTLSIYQSVYH